MTRYFEVLKRDGPARLGRLILKDPIQTPGLITSEDYVSLGTLWELASEQSAIEAVKSSSKEDKIVILPHFPISLHSKPPFDIIYPKRNGPTGLVIHPLFDSGKNAADLYVLGGAGSLSNPRELISIVTSARDQIPVDTALYAPALAVPKNLAFLIYLGIDVLDSTRAIADGYLGRYHLREGTWPISELTKLPCKCPYCQELEDTEDMDPRNKGELLAMHNSLKMEEELLLAREMVKAGRIREYIEKQVRVEPGLTAALRLLDEEHNFLERRTPVFRKGIIFSNTAESLQRVEVTRFADRVINRYTAPHSDILLLLPCSAKKPYSRSRSHRRFIMALGSDRKYVHEVILTSPLAIVPRELEAVYPAASYDVPVTGSWDLMERDWLLSCLDAYLEKNKYRTIIAHLEGELEETVDGHGIDAVYTGGGTDDEALKRLSSAVQEASSGASSLKGMQRRRFESIADYFFGSGAGIALVHNAKIKGRELHDEVDGLLATMTYWDMIALSIKGARRLEPRGEYIVNIDDFVPKGDVLSPGVLDADEQIRPGDEVIVRGDRAFGVGRARMSGWEMVESSRGVAVELRHVEKV